MNDTHLMLAHSKALLLDSFEFMNHTLKNQNQLEHDEAALSALRSQSTA